MKKFVLDFLHRALIAAGIGPIVLAIVYLIIQQATGERFLSVNEVCIGIFSLSALAFIAGGMNSVYQIEKLPLMGAITIHGVVLYIGYLLTYLINDWLNFGIVPIIIFSLVFVVGYVIIWAIIYAIIRKSTQNLNEKLKTKQKYN